MSQLLSIDGIAAAGRYHLYGSYGCPWCSRPIMMRKLKGLEEAVGMTILDPVRSEQGWRFTAADPDPVGGFEYLSQLYLLDDPNFVGRATAPLLWDAQTNSIASSDSTQIMRMFDQDLSEFAAHPERDYYPEPLHEQIDRLITEISGAISGGVYRVGAATTQQAYDQEVSTVFDALDDCERRLADSRFLTGDAITEADLCLAITLFRFDTVYVDHFKCNLRRIIDYPNLWGFARDIYQHPGVAGTVDFDHIKRHYYCSFSGGDEPQIVPAGPVIDWTEPHGRA